MKKSGQMDGKRVFSFADRKNLIDLSAHFAGYMSEHHSEVRQLRDIQTDHIQGFLDAKAETVSQATLQQYESRFRKLELTNPQKWIFTVSLHLVPRSMAVAKFAIKC